MCQRGSEGLPPEKMSFSAASIRSYPNGMEGVRDPGKSVVPIVNYNPIGR